MLLSAWYFSIPSVSRDQEMLNRWCSLTPDDLASQVKSHAEFQPEAPRPRPPPEEPPDDGNVTAAPEPWVMKEMDDLLQEIWLSGVEEAFAQVFNLMLNENVPGRDSIESIHLLLFFYLSIFYLICWF